VTCSRVVRLTGFHWKLATNGGKEVNKMNAKATTRKPRVPKYPTSRKHPDWPKGDPTVEVHLRKKKGRRKKGEPEFEVVLVDKKKDEE
jgi:hypothetical protein